MVLVQPSRGYDTRNRTRLGPRLHGSYLVNPRFHPLQLVNPAATYHIELSIPCNVQPQHSILYHVYIPLNAMSQHLTLPYVPTRLIIPIENVESLISAVAA